MAKRLAIFRQRTLKVGIVIGISLLVGAKQEDFNGPPVNNNEGSFYLMKRKKKIA